MKLPERPFIGYDKMNTPIYLGDIVYAVIQADASAVLLRVTDDQQPFRLAICGGSLERERLGYSDGKEEIKILWQISTIH